MGPNYFLTRLAVLTFLLATHHATHTTLWKTWQLFHCLCFREIQETGDQSSVPWIYRFKKGVWGFGCGFVPMHTNWLRQAKNSKANRPLYHIIVKTRNCVKRSKSLNGCSIYHMWNPHPSKSFIVLKKVWKIQFSGEAACLNFFQKSIRWVFYTVHGIRCFSWA